MSFAKPLSNKLIAALPPAERQAVLDLSTTVDLAAGELLYQPGGRIAHAWFPITSIISVHISADGYDGLGLGLIGSEALYGATAALGAHASPLRASVHYGGKAFRMRSEDFVRLQEECPALRRSTKRYVAGIISTLAQMAYCTCYHVLEARVAHWLLLTHDRVESNKLHLTHELLAEMLGVRRSGVSVAAASLQAQGLISYSRGTISVINRKGLEAASCECYAATGRATRATVT